MTDEGVEECRALRLWAFVAAFPLLLGACSDSLGDCSETRTCAPSNGGAGVDAGVGISSGGASADGGGTGSRSAGGASAGGAGTAGAGGASNRGAAGAAGAAGAGIPDAAAGLDGSSMPDTGRAADSGPPLCASGFADCNHRRDDGCEVDVGTDIDHCGECDVACAADGTTSHACNDGACEVVCDATHADCNKSGNDGCEVDLGGDPAHCGACGTACVATGTTQNTCVAGVCTPTCDPTHADCDKNGKNGCEVDLKGDPDHCGACATACAATGTTSRACIAGVCTPACDATHADCDKNGKNGCEVDLKGDPDHCGACSTACSTKNVKGRLCVAGACTPVCASGFDDCSTGTTKPNDGCETSLDDAASCGACGHSCLGGACSTEQCQALALGSSLPTPHGVAVDDKYVHWVDGTSSGGRLMRVALTGGTAAPFNTSPEPGPYDVTSNEGCVFWSDSGDGNSASTAAIKRYCYNAPTPVSMADGKRFPDAVITPQRIFARNSRIFWSNGSAGGVFYTIASSVEPAAVPGLSGVTYAITGDDTTIYTAFLDVEAARFDGTGTPVHYPVGDTLAVAVDDTQVYYPHASNLYSVSKDFSGTPKVVSAVSILPSSPLALDGSYAYYADDSNLYRVRKTGGTPQPLSNKVSNVFAIVVTDDAVYWSNTGTATANGSVMKLAL
jgi:hypothetical protein